MRQWRGRIAGAGEMLVLTEDVSRLSDPGLYDAARRRLPRFRQAKADSLLLERDRRLSVGAWLLLEVAFRMEGLRLGDYPVGCSERGKPYVSGCRLRFNIAHSGEYAMCAVSCAGEVGCDIQRVEAYDEGLARACMTPCELREIEALPQASQRARAFCRRWVAKESYVKALGCGLAKAPASFAVEFRDDRESGSLGSIRILDEAQASGATACEVFVPEGYCAALCVLDRLA